MKERWSSLNISKSKLTGHTRAQFLSKYDNNVEHDQECGDTNSVSKDSYFNLKSEGCNPMISKVMNKIYAYKKGKQ